MNPLHTAFYKAREYLARPSTTSTFRSTGQITPEEFVSAGDYLTERFPTWSWSTCPPSKRKDHLPAEKQYLVTRHVPCHKRFFDKLSGSDGKPATSTDEVVEKDSLDDEDGWLRTEGGVSSDKKTGPVKAFDERDGEEGLEDEIPDMEDDGDDDDDAIIKDTDKPGTSSPYKTYNLYIVYSTWYRTPQMFLSPHAPDGTPLPPLSTMEDVMGDYEGKTVTLDPFPHFEDGGLMAAIHPCNHAKVMKLLLDRAEAAVAEKKRKEREKKRRERMEKQGKESGLEKPLAGLLVAGESSKPNLPSITAAASADSSYAELQRPEVQSKLQAEDWEVLGEPTSSGDEDEPKPGEEAIRVDQYLIVFLKFMASVTPSIEHDFTMSM